MNQSLNPDVDVKADATAELAQPSASADSETTPSASDVMTFVQAPPAAPPTDPAAAGTAAAIPVIAAPVSPGASNDGSAAAAQDGPDQTDEATTADALALRPDAAPKSAPRGPNARAFAQANVHAQPALDAAAAKHAQADADASPSFEAARALPDVALRELPAAAQPAARNDAALAPLTPQLGGPSQPAGHLAPVQTRVDAPLTHPRFADEFGDKLVWLAKGQVTSAEIAVSPSELGPVRISIELRGTDATIHFGAAAAATRAALEDALPRLKELLSQQGLNLADANVGSETARDQRPQAQGSHARPGRAFFEAEATAAQPLPDGRARSLRLIDVVA